MNSARPRGCWHPTSRSSTWCGSPTHRRSRACTTASAGDVATHASRPPERLLAHYRVERRLADRLRRAPDAEARRRIFATMYEDLFREVPDHPRLRATEDASAQRERDVGWDLAQLRPYLEPGCTFLEIGAGDCALSARVAEGAAKVYAVDISDQHARALPPNAELVISDGTSIPVPTGSVDVAFSDQLMA